MNSFISDGVYFYHAVNGQNCYTNPITACQNPQKVDILNGNALISYCNDIQMGKGRDDGPYTITLETFEMKKSSHTVFIILLLILIIVTCVIIYLK